ncbi:MAG TPA: hypothetical protein VKG38_04520 [Solirubrobacteraceae bacterium]|nr:hypothetical protein [Solirubrobacteraceae bacterium]
MVKSATEVMRRPDLTAAERAARVPRVRRVATVGAVVLGMALAGCGGGGSGSQTSTTPSSGTSAAAEAPLQASGSPAVVASGIPFPTNLAFDAQGRLWITAATLGPSPTEGVWYMPPGGSARHVVGDLTAAGGLVWIGNRLYVDSATTPGIGQVNVLEGFNGSSFAQRRVLLKDLATGAHTLGALVLGPDGLLYVGLGAANDHSGAPGSVISFPPSGGATRVAATGVRTAYGLAFWGPQLLVTDNGPDEAGPEARDQLLAFDPTGPVPDFGFPTCYGQGGAACAGFKAPLATFPPHSAPAGVAVKGNVAYVADVGSAVAQSSAPSAIVRIDLQTGQQDIFWRSPVSHDVAGVAIGPEGDLYAALVVSGKIVRFHL